ncbi:MAG: PPC domain-containing protein, partial [Anaerolineae bacterium]|nr:PPC domain-containing protein [Anaerolineae bacterium]
MRTRTHILLLASLSLLLLAAAFPTLAQGGGTPVALGQIVNGAITNEVPQVLYSYTGQAGDIITISMTATGGGLDSYLQLLSPIGNPLYADDDGGGNLNALLGPYTLPETGTYTIAASRCCGNSPGGSTGTYTLVVNQASLGNLALDQTTMVDLTDAQPIVYLQFQGGAATPFLLSSRVIEGATAVVIDVHDPSGMSVNQLWHNNNVTASLDPLVLGSAGNYVFVVRRDLNAGSNQAPTRVAIDLRVLNVTPLSVGSTVSGTLDDGHPVDYYTFTGNATDLLRLSGQQATDGQPFDVGVYNTLGYNIGGGTTLAYDPTTSATVFTVDPLQLPGDDQYLIGIRRSITSDGMATGTSNYTLTLGPSQLQSLQSGVEVIG